MPRAIKGPRGSTNVDTEIGLRIRAARIDQDISQETLGNHLHVSFQQIQKYEKGTNRISGSRLVQIAKALNTTPHELLGWDRATKIDGWEFDLETYKLAQSFQGLPDHVKPRLRSLMDALKD